MTAIVEKRIRPSEAFMRRLRDTGISSNFIIMMVVGAGYLAFDMHCSAYRALSIPILFLVVTPFIGTIMKGLALLNTKPMRYMLDCTDKSRITDAQRDEVLACIFRAPWVIAVGTILNWIAWVPAAMLVAERFTAGTVHSYLELFLMVLTWLPPIYLVAVLRMELLFKPYLRVLGNYRPQKYVDNRLSLGVQKKLIFILGLTGPYMAGLFALGIYIRLQHSQSIPHALAEIVPIELYFVSASAGIAVIIAYYLSKVVNRPLQQITFALKTGESEFDSSGFDEFGVVSHLISTRRKMEVAKQEFFAIIGHELRSPLMSMHSFFVLLRQGAYGNVPETLLKKSAIAERNADRLIRLINDILDAEKLESGKFDCIYSPTHSLQIVQRAVETVKELAEANGVDVQMECRDEPIVCDEDRMVQVMVNLISNAIKNANGAPVVVTTQLQENEVEFGIKDSGAGIPPHMQESIFEKFKQLDSSNKTVKGTGLGLPIAKALVEQHGGSIGVKSAEGTGSYFWVRLPRNNESKSNAQ